MTILCNNCKKEIDSVEEYRYPKVRWQDRNIEAVFCTTQCLKAWVQRKMPSDNGKEKATSGSTLYGKPASEPQPGIQVSRIPGKVKVKCMCCGGVGYTEEELWESDC